MTWYLISRKPNESTDNSKLSQMYNPKNFLIANHLNIPLTVLSENKKLAHIDSGKKVSISEEDVEKYLSSGDVIHGQQLNDTRPLFSAKINTPDKTTVNQLHLGMITSRWVGADSDFNAIPGGNAVQGMPFVRIHNLTNKQISINGLCIPPKSIEKYTGRDHFGVRLGEVLTDSTGIFPDFVITKRCTDVYYGVCSDILQKDFGGYQNFIHLDHASDQPQWLLQEGYLSGPSSQQMEYKYVPRNQDLSTNERFPPFDRWGNML